jgi:signal transduction histidine kinase
MLVVARLTELTRGPVFERRFGDQGWTAMLGGANKQLLRTIPDSASAPSLPIAGMTGPSGTLTFEDGHARLVASWVTLEGGEWSVVAVGSVDEFAGPFVRQKVLDVALLVGVVSLVAVAFAWLVHRATRPLDALTRAADRIGAGDLTPDLPPAGGDEAGRLTMAFSTMTARIREMIAQVEADRQTAVLGRFAAELSHEIRNPLTAIKISLQGLERDARDGRIPESSRDSVRMALNEIRRLDDAVRTALRAGRPPAPPQRFEIRATIDAALTLLSPQAAALGIRIIGPAASTAELTGDEEGLRGAFVNLILNAIEASVGTIGVTRIKRDDSEIRITDDGPGDSRAEGIVFTPFFTTQGRRHRPRTLAAFQTVQAHGARCPRGSAPRRRGCRDPPAPSALVPGAEPAAPDRLTTMRPSGHPGHQLARASSKSPR